jgi:hypothetical protein
MPLLTDYTIDHAGVEWPDLLSSWAWLLPRELSVWLVNRFGDLFLTYTDASINMLDVGRGAVSRLAKDREEFACLLDEGNNATDWLAIPLVEKLVAARLLLGPGQCYSYIRLPVLGGDYTVENTRVVSLTQHYRAFGPIHEKLKDIPDGTAIEFDVAG